MTKEEMREEIGRMNDSIERDVKYLVDLAKWILSQKNRPESYTNYLVSRRIAEIENDLKGHITRRDAIREILGRDEAAQQTTAQAGQQGDARGKRKPEARSRKPTGRPKPDRKSPRRCTATAGTLQTASAA